MWSFKGECGYALAGPSFPPTKRPQLPWKAHPSHFDFQPRPACGSSPPSLCCLLPAWPGCPLPSQSCYCFCSCARRQLPVVCQCWRALTALPYASLCTTVPCLVTLLLQQIQVRCICWRLRKVRVFPAAFVFLFFLLNKKLMFNICYK